MYINLIHKMHQNLFDVWMNFDHKTRKILHWCHDMYLDNKVNGANMGSTWVLSAPGEPNVGPMILAIRVMTMDMLYQCKPTKAILPKIENKSRTTCSFCLWKIHVDCGVSKPWFIRECRWRIPPGNYNRTLDCIHKQPSWHSPCIDSFSMIILKGSI